MNEFTNSDNTFQRTWQELHRRTQPLLTAEELESVKGLSSNINVQDVVEVYLPLVGLIQIYKNARENLPFSKSIFLKKEMGKRPFIIDISGSAAVGKSTTNRLLQLLLSRTFRDNKAEMATTDGFIYPNGILIEQSILDRKGFPESCSMELLLNLLNTTRNGIVAEIPVYSHEIYDIIPGQKQTIDTPDPLVIGGVNVFQNQESKRSYMTGHFDFPVYVNAENNNIKKWYLECFKSLLELAKVNKNSCYYHFVDMSQSEALALAESTRRTINLVNPEKYIEPTRNRAELILHRTVGHKIDSIYPRKQVIFLKG